jgi:hypothetical protein
VDKVVEKLVALGVPGLVLLVAIATRGVHGGAALVAALAFLGGPLGMLGGIAVLGILGLVSRGVASYRIEALFQGVVEGLCAKGKTHEQIRKELGGHPISQAMKRALFEPLERLP